MRISRFRLSLALCLVLALATVSQAADITLSYANFPPASTFPCVQMERWADEVEKRTDGKVKVETYPGSTLLGAKNMFRGVQMGQADIGCISTSYQPGVFPFSFACNQPVGFTSATVASMTLWDLFVKYQPEEFDGVKVLTMFTSAPSHLMSKEPVRTLDGFKGLRVRASGTLAQTMTALDASPVAMPMPEVPEAVQKGVVTSLLTSFDVLKDMNFAETTRYETILNFPVYPFAVIMNKRAWASLPEDVKQVMDDMRREQALWTGKYMDRHVANALDWSREKYGIEVIELPEADYAEAHERIRPLVDEWKVEAREAGLPADKIMDDLKAFKAEHEKQYGE
ncbi:TRAP transporter substrate-binding protein [Desulfohalovibrio reitneri]|uniref:TRAP transporter substrate-binding protein n=1 Tax=Desulfohalovibrio reitneri TaxID=1307759 RepID=UPI0004A73E78|nr:TRAP transporter substrate-binding protein [Desulfohalovibrio reitneri]